MADRLKRKRSLNPAPQSSDLFFEPANLSNEGVELLAKYPSLVHRSLGHPLRALGCAKVHHVGLLLAYKRFLQPIHAGHERVACAAQFIDQVSTKAAQNFVLSVDACFNGRDCSLKPLDAGYEFGVELSLAALQPSQLGVYLGLTALQPFQCSEN